MDSTQDEPAQHAETESPEQTTQQDAATKRGRAPSLNEYYDDLQVWVRHAPSHIQKIVAAVPPERALSFLEHVYKSLEQYADKEVQPASDPHEQSPTERLITAASGLTPHLGFQNDSPVPGSDMAQPTERSQVPDQLVSDCRNLERIEQGAVLSLTRTADVHRLPGNRFLETTKQFCTRAELDQLGDLVKDFIGSPMKMLYHGDPDWLLTVCSGIEAHGLRLCFAEGNRCGIVLPSLTEAMEVAACFEAPAAEIQKSEYLGFWQSGTPAARRRFAAWFLHLAIMQHDRDSPEPAIALQTGLYLKSARPLLPGRRDPSQDGRVLWRRRLELSKKKDSCPSCGEMPCLPLLRTPPLGKVPAYPIAMIAECRVARKKTTAQKHRAAQRGYGDYQVTGAVLDSDVDDSHDSENDDASLASGDGEPDQLKAKGPLSGETTIPSTHFDDRPISSIPGGSTEKYYSLWASQRHNAYVLYAREKRLRMRSGDLPICVELAIRMWYPGSPVKGFRLKKTSNVNQSETASDDRNVLSE